MLLGEMLRFGCISVLSPPLACLASECARVCVAQEIALEQAEAKRVKLEKKEARRAAIKIHKENSPRRPPLAVLASPMTGTVPMPGVPLVSVVPIPFVSPAEAQPVATVAPVPGSLVRL